MGVDVYPLAHASTAVHLQYAWWTVALYVIGVFSLVFHFANGMWTFAITWGLTISRAAQRRWGQACAALGVVLVFFSAAAIGSAMTYDIDEASRVIQIYEKKLDGGELTPEDRAYLAELAEARTDASIGSHNH
jgi:succinate dehydrogenase / fumarate reductase cytochrome b subunit